MGFRADLELLVRANYKLVVIGTPEEGRVVTEIQKVCEEELKVPLITWDIAQGFRVVYGPDLKYNFPEDPELMTGLEEIEKFDGKGIFLLKDMHDHWDNAVVKRKIRNMGQGMKPGGKCMVVVCPTSSYPEEWKDDAVILDFPLPREKELGEVLDWITSNNKTLKVELEAHERRRLLQGAVGLSAMQAKRAFFKAFAERRVLDASHIKMIIEEKRQVIRENPALEFEGEGEQLVDVGGLDQLKDWLRQRKGAFGDRAKNYKLPMPKGVLLFGIPGTGKSLAAKVIGGYWGLPLLRLDVGALFGQYVGQSEERTRAALKVVEAIAPCVLLIDEIDKGLGGSGNESDTVGGTSQRVFGTILTWLQEKEQPVFVVATANRLQGLPPELFRAGRFDEKFFMDLPSEDERKEILKVHIKKVGRPAEAFDLPKLAKACNYFVGSEIEAAIQKAMYRAFNDESVVTKKGPGGEIVDEPRPFTTDDVLEAMKEIIPMAESHKESVASMRQWLKEGRARSASYKGPVDALQKAPIMEEFDVWVKETR